MPVKSIKTNAEFNRALTDLAIGTHDGEPNDEIYLIAAIDAQCQQQEDEAVKSERKRWLSALTHDVGDGPYCRVCGYYLEYGHEDGCAMKELENADS